MLFLTYHGGASELAAAGPAWSAALMGWADGQRWLGRVDHVRAGPRPQNTVDRKGVEADLIYCVQ